jgi:rhodanese-related sulfurtransferase/biotin operon repressor
MAHRDFKDRIYAQFARVGQALASERRLELLDLLAQAPRHVEALAQETGMSVANTSQHLQALRSAGLIESERQGTRVLYRLAAESVLRLWLALRSVAEARLADVPAITRRFMSEEAMVSREELARLLAEGRVHLIDVRPPAEFEQGHLAGAVSVPVDKLEERLQELPRDRLIVAYCRGEYCLFAGEAVALLRQYGYNAVRLEGGWPEWLVEGRPVTLSRN